VFKFPHFSKGVMAQFFYVGAQVCISSFFIRYSKFRANIGETEATNYLGYLLLFFMLGRYVGTFLMQKIAPAKLLTIYSAISALLLMYIVVVGGFYAMYAFMGVEFFMSIMFPTIFALGIKNLGHQTKMASSFMVMSIVGGALIPLALGYLAHTINIQVAYVVPLICFIVIFYYGYKGHVIKNNPPVNVV
jgi:FHS family L-fucose permease-like MFS transporter